MPEIKKKKKKSSIKVLNSFTLQYIVVSCTFKYSIFMNTYVDEDTKPPLNQYLFSCTRTPVYGTSV